MYICTISGTVVYRNGRPANLPAGFGSGNAFSFSSGNGFGFGNGNGFAGIPLLRTGLDPNQADEDEPNDTVDFGESNHQIPMHPHPEVHINNKKKPSKYTTKSGIEHPITAAQQQQQYLIAPISPAIIPLTYYPIQSDHTRTSATNNGPKKSSANTRPKPPDPPKKPPPEHQQNAIPINAVPLLWYPTNPVHSANLQSDSISGGNKHYSTPQSSMSQSSQIQAMNLATYYEYLKQINPKQKHSN